MRQFYEVYAQDKKVSALLTQLPWTHNLIILSSRMGKAIACPCLDDWTGLMGTRCFAHPTIYSRYEIVKLNQK